MNTSKAATRSVRPKIGAQILGVSDATFWRYTQREDFPQLKRLSPRCTVVDVDELIAWRDRQGEPQPETKKPATVVNGSQSWKDKLRNPRQAGAAGQGGAV